MGRTITTDTRMSIIIIALLAVMSSLGAAHLWNLLLFAFHQRNATRNLIDTLTRQQQALVRALPTPSSLTAETLKLWWLWRHKEGRVHLRCLIPALLALCFAISTIFASVFSSYIVDTSNIEVLVDSPYCGYRDAIRYYSTDVPEEQDYVSIYEKIGDEYARECYKSSTTLPTRCRSVFVKPNISFMARDGSCPFSPNMCAPKDSPAIVLDSGLLDLNEDFGFNLGVSDRVKFRRRTSCTVLPANGYVRTLNRSEIPDILIHYLLPKPRFEFPFEQIEVSLYGGITNSSGIYLTNDTDGLQQITLMRSLLSTNASYEYNSEYVQS